LTGHSAEIDPTVHAVRGDLADVTLADKVFAPHYARSISYCALIATPIMVKAKGDGAVCGHLLKGDVFHVFDFSGGWAWGRTEFAVGYVPETAIEPQ
jgi:Variant SH3 domain